MALKEFTPVMTTPFTNIVDPSFRQTMKDVSASMKELFEAHSNILIPGSGTYAMEASARQFCTNKKMAVIQCGYFGFRWSEIVAQGGISQHLTLLKASRTEKDNEFSSIQPPSLDTVRSHFQLEKPEVVLMSHTDTSTGIMLSHEYIKAVSDAAKSVGALVILDCIASGCIWTPMKQLGLDVIITAPQKAFYAPASVGIVLLSEGARKQLDGKPSSSFTLDLKKWAGVQEAYENGGFAYHTTLPTVGIEQFAQALKNLEHIGSRKLGAAQADLGNKIRGILEGKGLKSVAGEGSQSPTVVVYYHENPGAVVAAFKARGFKIAGGFGFFLGETSKPKSFRIGLFGNDKLSDVYATARDLDRVITSVFDELANPKAKL